MKIPSSFSFKANSEGSQGTLTAIINGWEADYFDVEESIYLEISRSDGKLDVFNSLIWNKGFEHKRNWKGLDQFLNHLKGIFDYGGYGGVNDRDCFDDQPIHIACIWGDIGALELLVANGADVNAKGEDLCTPIYNAISRSHLRCIRFLLQNGATIDDRNDIGGTAKECAEDFGDAKVLKLLEEYSL